MAESRKIEVVINGLYSLKIEGDEHAVFWCIRDMEQAGRKLEYRYFDQEINAMTCLQPVCKV